MVAYWLPSLWACSWPHLLRSNSMIDGTKYPGDYVKIAVITDPQLMDKTSLNLAPKSLALEMAQFYTDLYMRQAFLASVIPFKPDVILYLGDYFDEGPYLSDEEWQESLDRLKHIFGLDSQGRHRDIKAYFLPGNHDIGYESIHTHRPQVANWYEKEFGKRNYRFTVGKLEFIAIDAQTLDAHHQQKLASSPLEFVKNLPGYQNYVSEATSDSLLELINLHWAETRNNTDHTDHSLSWCRHVIKEHQEVLILSGHDHDRCNITHESTYGRVVEVICSIYFHHSCPAALVNHYTSFWHQLNNFLGYGKQLLSGLFSATKEKNKDINCEYEMMWDAEGSMHLVKKKLEHSYSNTFKSSAVIRPTAGKNISQESDMSLSVDNNADIGSDHMTKLPPRTSKSWRKIVILRLLRAFLMLYIIAVVNVPLYIILLFKDWIDQ